MIFIYLAVNTVRLANTGIHVHRESDVGSGLAIPQLQCHLSSRHPNQPQLQRHIISRQTVSRYANLLLFQNERT
jgi:hypothetical protein